MFEGELQVEASRGNTPGRLLSRAKVKIAMAPEGKSFLQIEPIDKDAYLLVSNGQKSWAYVPRLKQYTEQEAAAVEDSDDNEPGDAEDERDLSERFVRLLFSKLSTLNENVSQIVAAGEGEVKYADRKQTWPIIKVLSNKDKNGAQDLTEVALDPATLAVGRMVWTELSWSGQEKSVVRLTANFNSFHTGDAVAESMFVFEPPKKVKLVDAVPIPGQTGSFLLNQPAPDFELKTISGDKIRLADLRDRPVLLSFWASWCGPCRRELPELSRINQEYKDKGLVVLGVNDEGKGTARDFAAKASLSFDTLDDAGRKVHRLYRVSAIPSVFVIDRHGKVVRFLRGSHSEAALLEALKTAGL